MKPSSLADLSTFTSKQLRDYLLSHDYPFSTNNRNFLLAKAISVFKDSSTKKPSDSSFAAPTSLPSPKKSFQDVKAAVDLYSPKKSLTNPNKKIPSSPSKNSKNSKNKSNSSLNLSLSSNTSVNTTKDSNNSKEKKKSISRMTKLELIDLIKKTFPSKYNSDSEISKLKKTLKADLISLLQSPSKSPKSPKTKKIVEEVEIISSPIKHYSKKRLNPSSELNSDSSLNSLNTSPLLEKINISKSLSSPTKNKSSNKSSSKGKSIKRKIRLPDSPVPQLPSSASLPLSSSSHKYTNNSNNSNSKEENKENKGDRSKGVLGVVVVVLLGVVVYTEKENIRNFFIKYKLQENLLNLKKIFFYKFKKFIKIFSSFKKIDFFNLKNSILKNLNLNLEKMNLENLKLEKINFLKTFFVFLFLEIIRRNFSSFKKKKIRKEKVNSILEYIFNFENEEGVPLIELENLFKGNLEEEEWERVLEEVRKNEEIEEGEEFLGGRVLECLKRKDRSFLIESPDRFELSDMDL